MKDGDLRFYDQRSSVPVIRDKVAILWKAGAYETFAISSMEFQGFLF
jgi:hypothetical protein